MNIAVVAPAPVPLTVGGAENLWWGLVDHLNRETRHHADLIKLPTPERSFWEIVDGYRRWAELDVSGYDLVISGKYPAWMVAHPCHVCYLLHPLRGLYDTYPPGWPEVCDSSDPDIRGLLTVVEAGSPQRDALDESFARLDALRPRDDLAPELFALPGPLIRQLVHFFDAIGRSEPAVVRQVALSRTVARRPGYFAPGQDVAVAHAPTSLRGLRAGRGLGHYLFTASRLDAPKRIDLLIAAMAHVRARIELRIAGSGPQDAALRELAASDPRIKFMGFLTDDELARAYRGARAVLFAPSDEDYGYITLEAMLCARPVFTTRDSGGPMELVEPGVTGLATDPEPQAMGRAIELLVRRPQLAWRLGRAGRRRAHAITWNAVVSTLLDGIEPRPG